LKYIFLIIIVLLILPISTTFGQISLGKPALQTVEITLDEEGNAHVIHKISKSNSIQEFDVIDNSFTNLIVKDVEGNDAQHGIVNAEKTTISIFPTNYNVVAEYDLDNILTLKDGIWTWDYLYLASTAFIFPEKVDLIFANNRPVLISDVRGINCHGCEMVLEYIIDEPVILKNIKWEERNFVVAIRTLTEINSFNFDQPTKTISFNINENNQLMTLIIPLELLWNPYEVWLDDQKILKHEFFTNETHVWLNIRPEHSGTVQIIGTTVVPEFPLLIPLVIGIMIVVVFQLRNKLNFQKTFHLQKL